MLKSVALLKSRPVKLVFEALNCNHVQRKVHSVELSCIPKITVPEIRKLLRQKGFAVQDGFTSLTTKCNICSGEQKCSERKLYINKTNGYFLCPNCNVHGNWNILEKHVKRTKVDSTTKEHIDKCLKQYEEFQKDWQVLVSETSPLSTFTESGLFELAKLFEFPTSLADKDTSKVLSDVRVSKDQTILYFPLKNSLENVVGYHKIQAGKEEEAGTYGLAGAGLFWGRATKVSRNDQAVVVNSIHDIIHLAAHKVQGTLVWLSNSSLPPTLLPALEPYQKLCLWGDWENMRDVAEKLGEDRCSFVRPTEGLVTAAQAARAGLPLRALAAAARPAAHRAITTFAALRDDVYADLANIDKVRGVKWRRFPALTRLLGGHRRGELTVLTGPTGCGKTTLCAEMSLDLAQQGVSTLWGSFEIRAARLARTMLQQLAGVPLERHLPRFAEFADDFQKLPIYFLAFHGQQPINVVMEAVEHARYMHGIQHVVVDNVQFMLGLEAREDRYARQDAVVAAFRAFATARHAHVTLVMHPRKERDSEDLSTSSIFGSAKASQEADNVLIIQDKRLTAVRGKKYLQIAKNRFSGDLGIVPLEFDKEALSYQAKKKGKAKSEELLEQCFEEFAVADAAPRAILNLNRTR